MLAIRSLCKGIAQRALAAPSCPEPRSWGRVHGRVSLPTIARPGRLHLFCWGEMEAARQSIITANIERFKLLLTMETDPTKRAMEIRLLAEEEEKLAKMPKPEKKETWNGNSKCVRSQRQ